VIKISVCNEEMRLAMIRHCVDCDNESCLVSEFLEGFVQSIIDKNCMVVK